MWWKAYVSQVRLVNWMPLSLSTVDGAGDGSDQVAQEQGGDILPVCSCNSTSANLPVRSIATNRRSLPSAVCTSAMSTWREADQAMIRGIIAPPSPIG